MKIIDLTAKSKNFTKGREGRKVKYIAIHWLGTKGATGESSANYLLNNNKNTSTHYVVEDNNVWLVVHPENTAYAVGDWIGNTESISIEMSATVDRLASELTYKTTVELIIILCDLYNLKIDNKTIRPHSSFSATQCPGTINIPKLIKFALESTTESPEAIKIKELEIEKDNLEKEIKKLKVEIKSLKNDVSDRDTQVDVFRRLSDELSKEVKSLKVSTEKAVELAEDWEAQAKESDIFLKEQIKEYKELLEKVEVLEGENTILQTANKQLAFNSKKLVEYNFNELLVAILNKLKG